MFDDLVVIPNEVPLFPLPGVVLFPRAVLPLHIFEPRYQEMTADALAGPSVLGIALLKPGFEPEYYTPRAPIYPLVGVGQIVASEQLDDGRYNMLVRGVTRARIIEEVPHRPYRVARIEEIKSLHVEREQEHAAREDLLELVRTEVPENWELRDYWLRLLASTLHLGEVVDLIASSASLAGELQHVLFEERNPLERAATLSDHIRTTSAVRRTRRTRSPGADWSMN